MIKFGLQMKPPSSKLHEQLVSPYLRLNGFVVSGFVIHSKYD